MAKDLLLNLNNNFEKAREFIESQLGIDLTLIELVELRRGVEFTTELYKKDTKKEIENNCVINPPFDAAFIFMNKNYGTQIYNLADNSNFNLNRFLLIKKFGLDYYPKYFKRVQEDMHFP